MATPTSGGSPATTSLTGAAKGRLRDDARALRFVEVVVNGPKSWSLAAALHPDIATAYDAAMDRAAGEVIGWVAEHATTRVGPRGRQVQVPVEKLEAAVVRHYTSRAGDPHRHLHVQINARVFARGAWRGLHSVGVVDSIEALNGIGHAAVMCDPEFRAALAARGYTLDDDGEIQQLAPYAGRFSQRAAQINRNVDRYEAAWRAEHPGQEPGPRLRRTWDRRAWADARPDKVVPRSGADLVAAWNNELRDLGFTPPTTSPPNPVTEPGLQIGRLNRDVAADLVLTRLGAKRSAWNAADIRGEVERLIASVGVVAERPVRHELVEDIADRARTRCVPLLDRDDVPEHVRSLTSERVLAVEADLVDSIAARAARPVNDAVRLRGIDHLDPAQRRVVAALAGDAGLLVIEGAAGTGKTTTLAAARDVLDAADRRLVVVTPPSRPPKPRSSRSAPTRSPPPGSSTSTATAGTRTATGHESTPHPAPHRTHVPVCSPATSSSSTRPACSTRTPPARCSPSPTEPTPPSRSSATATSCRPSAAAASSTSPHAGCDPQRTTSSSRSTGSAIPRTPTSACSCALVSGLVRSSTRSSSAARSSSMPARSNAPQPWPPSAPTVPTTVTSVIADTRDQVGALNAAIRDRRHGAGVPPGKQSGEPLVSIW